MKCARKRYSPLLHLFTVILVIAGCTSKPEANGSTGEPNPPTRPTVFTSPEERFIGEWESLEFPNRPHFTIEKNGKNYIVQEGKGEFPATFDESNNILRFNAPGATFDIAYIEKDDMILVSSGGKYRRVSKSE